MPAYSVASIGRRIQALHRLDATPGAGASMGAILQRPTAAAEALGEGRQCTASGLLQMQPGGDEAGSVHHGTQDASIVISGLPEGTTCSRPGAFEGILLRGLTRCDVSLGPSAGPVSLEDVVDSVVRLAGHQVRLRGCSRVRLEVHTATTILLEDCDCVTVVPFIPWYASCAADMVLCRLDASQNRLKDVVDFDNPSSI